MILFLFSLPLYSQDEALKYLEEISEEYEQVVRAQWQYAQAVVEGGAFDREKEKLISSITSAIGRITNIPPYRRDRALRDSVLAFLELNRKMIREDYTQLADLEIMENKTYEELDEYLFAQENAYDRLGKLSESLRKEEEKFARKHGIRLVKRDDKFARKLLLMNEMFSYYNRVYLQFYKSYSQELVVFRTIQEQDPEKIQEELTQLSANAKAGIRQLKQTGGYKGDRSMYEAAQESLQFYQQEAEESLQPVLRYYQKLRMLEILREKRKQGEANSEEYNQLVREINESANTLNQINENLNTRRSELLARWNSVSESFLVRQLP